MTASDSGPHTPPDSSPEQGGDPWLLPDFDPTELGHFGHPDYRPFGPIPDEEDQTHPLSGFWSSEKIDSRAQNNSAFAPPSDPEYLAYKAEQQAALRANRHSDDPRLSRDQRQESSRDNQDTDNVRTRLAQAGGYVIDAIDVVEAAEVRAGYPELFDRRYLKDLEGAIGDSITAAVRARKQADGLPDGQLLPRPAFEAERDAAKARTIQEELETVFNGEVPENVAEAVEMALFELYLERTGVRPSRPRRPNNRT